MAAEPDHYATLGVDPDASAEEIKRAWRKGIVAHHPDRGGDRERFDAVQAAWECLGDPAARASYDRRRMAPPLVNDLFTGVGQVFNSAYGTGGPPSGPNPTGQVFTMAGDELLSQVADAVNQAWQPAPDLSSTLLFTFPDGEDVELASRNRHGAIVPDEHQRTQFNMGPKFVYRALRPRDRVFAVVTPSRTHRPVPPGEMFSEAFAWLVWRGPRWFRPRFRWLATLLLVAAFAVGAMAGGPANPADPHWGLLAVIAAVWWPLPRTLCLVWDRAPRAAGVAATALAAGLVTAASAHLDVVGSLVSIAGWAGVCAAAVVVLRKTKTKLLGVLPAFISERLAGAGVFSATDR